MPKNTKPPAPRRTKTPVSKTNRPARPPVPAQRPANLRTQIRGGRPPRIPGRTGGR